MQVLRKRSQTQTRNGVYIGAQSISEEDDKQRYGSDEDGR